MTIKDENYQKILDMAGSWNDWSREDFDDFREEVNRIGKELFAENANQKIQDGKDTVYKTADEAFQMKYDSMKELLKDVDLRQLEN
ncbi:hypothetical protein [Larkinella rosea]|uniref:Uncharacterized protein n=1 Tax=Larkinella rosea TaxID=2025312 RepID=A0A3P1C3D3_9BACT|nr:hypothetical protein [Larkinella rosea]RRB07792.1 hypothetical protein EHT25_08455 [Larkinella rosea]